MIARKQDAISAVGILKRDEESGTIVPAVLGTDYGTYSKPDGGIPTNDIALSAITEDRIADEAVGESKLKKFTAWTAVDLPEGWTLHSVTWIERNSRWDCHIKSPDGGLYGGVTESGQSADGVEARFYVYVGSAYVGDEIIFNAKRSTIIPKKTSDLTNDGDGESSFITKTRAEEGWWGEWILVSSYAPAEYLTTMWVEWDAANLEWLLKDVPDEPVIIAAVSGNEDDVEVVFPKVSADEYTVTATRHRVCAPIPTKPSDIGAQPAGNYAKPEDVEPLQCAAWFPDSSVKSYAQCTQTLKYAYDTTNCTATVLPFSTNGAAGEGNNADATGDIVIPPYKDYDGVRYMVTGIGGFMGNDQSTGATITSIKAPMTVNIVENNAFHYCASLASVSLPACALVRNSAFYECTSLASVSLPACTNVSSGAFGNCTSLASVNFGIDARESVPTLGDGALESVPNTCKIIVPDANYDAWTAPKLPDGETDNPWYALVQAGYRFIKYSQWEAPHRYELDTKYTKPATGIPTNDIADGAVTEAKLAKFTEWVCNPATVYNYDHTTQYPLTVEWDDSDNAYDVFVEMGPVGRLGPFIDFDAGDSATELSVTMSDPELETTTVTATRRRVIPSKTSDLENDGEDGTSPYATKSDTTLTPVYSDTPTFSEWTFSGDVTPGVVYSVEFDTDEIPGFVLARLYADGTEKSQEVVPNQDVTSITFLPGFNPSLTAVRARTDIINYTLGSQTDKPLQPAGEFVKRSGDTMTGDLTVLTHAAVGNNIDFTKGGPENFAVGHDHYIYGKESFTVHDGNRVGARGFYWKAIDTTEHKIYLTKEQIKYGNPIEPDSRCLPIVSLSDALKISTHPEYDVPYFGPKANSAHQELFAAEEGIGIGISGGSLVGKYITVVNMWHDLYVRCFKVEAVDSTGSVITYSEVKQLSTYDAEKTFYRKTVAVGGTISYHDNQYVIFFPEVDQSLVVGNHYVTATSFGCTALGDANHVMGYNSFASGFQNRAEGNYSVAIGSYNTAAGVDSVAIGQKAIASKNFDFVWNGNVDSVSHYASHGKSTFNVNPKPVSGNDPFTGFYIGEESLADRLSAFMASVDVNALVERINVLEAQVRQLSAYHVPSDRTVLTIDPSKSYLLMKPETLNLSVVVGGVDGQVMLSAYDVAEP